MSGQLNYTYQTPVGVAGGLYDLSPKSIDARINGETDVAKLKFGMGVVQGSNPGTDVLVPVAASTLEQFEGVIMNGFTNEMGMTGEVCIFPRQTVGVLRWGRLWVRVADGVEPAYGESLHLIIDGADAGKFTNTAGTDTLEINGIFIGALGTGNVAPAMLYNQKA